MNEATRRLIVDGHANIELVTALQWSPKGAAVISSTRLKSSLSDPLHLFIRIPACTPHSPTLLIRDGDAGPNNAIRLDVRSTHRNRKTDGRFWDRATHLHLWTDAHSEEHAVDPEGWAPTGVPPGDEPYCDRHLELIMNYFCQMVGIKCSQNYAWGDPLSIAKSLEPARTVNGDEIP